MAWTRTNSVYFTLIYFTLPHIIKTRFHSLAMHPENNTQFGGHKCWWNDGIGKDNKGLKCVGFELYLSEIGQVLLVSFYEHSNGSSTFIQGDKHTIS